MCMGGPTAQQQQLAGSQTQFMDTLRGNYNTQFAEEEAVLSHLNATLAPTIAGGPGQTGFTPSERAALETRAINTTGANFAAATRRAQTELAGRGAGGNLPESGVDQQIKASIAAQAAGQLSSEELGITEADYATGRQNYREAIGAGENLARLYNPESTGALAESASKEAFGEQTQIAQEEAQQAADIFGGITSLAGAATGGIAGAMGGGGLKGGLTALAGGL